MHKIVVNLFLRSVSAFSPHGYEVMGSVAQPSSINHINSGFKLVSEGFDKYEVIPDHQGPTKLKRLASLLQLGCSMDWHRLVSLLSCTSSIQFCYTSNVSDLILQCAFSHVDFQTLQFNCSMSSILH